MHLCVCVCAGSGHPCARLCTCRMNPSCPSTKERQREQSCWRSGHLSITCLLISPIARLSTALTLSWCVSGSRWPGGEDRGHPMCGGRRTLVDVGHQTSTVSECSTEDRKKKLMLSPLESMIERRVCMKVQLVAGKVWVSVSKEHDCICQPIGKTKDKNGKSDTDKVQSRKRRGRQEFVCCSDVGKWERRKHSQTLFWFIINTPNFSSCSSQTSPSCSAGPGFLP